MSEDQLKAADIEATAQVEDTVEEISEEDLAGVAAGGGETIWKPGVAQTSLKPS